MSEKTKTGLDMSCYDSAFKLALDLLYRHINSGNATTADLPECFAGLIQVIRDNQKADSPKDE